jgi:hypothetical protein
MDIHKEAQSLSDLAFQGDGCAIQDKMVHILRRDLGSVFEMAQQIADQRTKDAASLPVVTFTHDGGFLTDSSEVQVIGGAKQFRKTIAHMSRGDTTLFEGPCEKP